MRNFLTKPIKNNKKGFSLVELIVVIAIMAVLIAILVPSLLGYIDDATITANATMIDEAGRGLMLAYAKDGSTGTSIVSLKKYAGLEVTVATLTMTTNQQDRDKGLQPPFVHIQMPEKGFVPMMIKLTGSKDISTTTNYYISTGKAK